MKSEKVFIGDTEIDIDTQIELAEHGLKVAINHLNELLAKRNALHAHMDAEAEAYFDGKDAEVYNQACKEEREIAEVMHDA